MADGTGLGLSIVRRIVEDLVRQYGLWQQRLTEWQRSIDDPALELEAVFLEAKRKARAKWQ